ncbi:NAD(P)/FAD-dependent oxidoreductase [Phytomonospora sp. NPDC050363]|uniref:phytoene desaturase family protein n=1 Tax=Phytomonospora sp. NPDC050363 TaxID=3155642 RepID=UPI0033EED840
MTSDAVVVGAGHNGLVAANMLADAGWSVTVLEATAHPGGGVRSAEITAAGFRSDLCSAFYPFTAVSPVFARLALEEHGLRWRHAPAVLAHALPDGRSAVLSRDVETTAASVDAFAEGDGAAWRHLFDEWRRIGGPVVDALFTPFPPVRPVKTLTRRIGTAGLLRLARRMAMSVREFGEENFAGEGAKVLLTGCALHSDVSPEGTGSAAYGWLLAMVGQQLGFPVPEGGAQSITDALIARLEAKGGRVVCDAPVTKVIVAGGVARGVVDAAGRPWKARHAVLADVPATTLYRDLVGLDRLPARLAGDLDRVRLDHPTLKVDWALSGPVPWTDPGLAAAGTVHLGGDTADLSHWAASLAAHTEPAVPFILTGQMGRADPTRSPAGTETLWAYTHLPATLRDADRDDPGIVEYAERIEAAVAAVAPGMPGLVLARHVEGPADLARANPGMVDGALGAGTSAPSQQLVFRPTPGLGRADSPVDRLYLAGAAAHPGPGVHGGPGANAARAALRRAVPVGGAVYRGLIRAAQRLVY